MQRTSIYIHKLATSAKFCSIRKMTADLDGCGGNRKSERVLDFHLFTFFFFFFGPLAEEE